MKVHEVMTVDGRDDDAGERSLKEAALELATHGGSRACRSSMTAGKVVGVLSEADILAKEGDEQERDAASCSGSSIPTDPWVAARFDAVTVGDAMSSPREDDHPAPPCRRGGDG